MECNAESIIRVEPELTVLNHISWSNKYCEAICEQGGRLKRRVWSYGRFLPGFISQLLSWLARVGKASGCPSLLGASRFNIRKKNKSYSPLFTHWIFCSRSSSLQWIIAYGFTSPPEYLACLNSPLCYDQRNIYPEWHHDLMHDYCFADIAWEPPVLN